MSTQFNRSTSPTSVDLTVDCIPNKLTTAQGQVQRHLDPAWEQVGGRGRQNVPVRPAEQLINLRCDEIQDERQASTLTDVIQLDKHAMYARCRRDQRS